MSSRGWRRLGDLGAPLGIPPAAFILLTTNLAMFVLVNLAGFLRLDAWLYFSSHLAIHKLQIWRFASYMFLHGHLWHLLFNMIVLWLFGSRMEQYWGTRTFTWYYFVCGVGGAVLHGLFSPVPVVGASAALLGLKLAFGLAFPRVLIFVFGIIPVPAFILVIFLALASIFQIGAAQTAHLAHLGGMVTGFIFLWIFTGGRFARVPQLPHSGSARGGYRTMGAGPYRRGASRGSMLARIYEQFLRWRTRMRLTVVEGRRATNSRTDPGATTSNRRKTGGNGKKGGSDLDRVDEILEKISRQGLKSLTPEEQEILRRASKHD